MNFVIDNKNNDFVPKIIHQIWLYDIETIPLNIINTWKNMHPDYKYILWTEDEINKNINLFKCHNKLYEINDINIKIDILKWEILYNYGGIYIDIDNICIEKINDYLLNKNFCSYEVYNNKNILSECVIGFNKYNEFINAIIEYILDMKNIEEFFINNKNLLTYMYNKKIYFELIKDINILPNYSFIPSHYNGYEYKSFGKVYSYKIWYNIRSPSYGLNNFTLPSIYNFIPSEKSVSLLIPSYNTNINFIEDCLNSIMYQEELCNIEIIWIDDGSSKENSEITKNMLNTFLLKTRFIKIVYHKNNTNMGIGYTLNLGVNLCNNEIILRMDSDDIMICNRVHKQLTYMLDNSNVMMCASQVAMFKDNIDNITEITNHKTITWDQYKSYPLQWFVNHPTYCFRKQAALEIGNYDINAKKMMDDFSFSIRMLKKYGYIYNFSEPLLYYRVHNTQVSNINSDEAQYFEKERIKLIREMLYN